MKRPLHLACVALLASGAAASAANWVLLADNPGMQLSLNSEGRKTRDGTHTVQYRIDFKQPQKNAEGKAYQSSTMTVSVACPAKTVALQEYVVNAKPRGEGDVVVTHKVAAPVANKVVALSSDELIWNAVCAPAAAPASTPPAAPKPAAPKK